MSKIFTRNVKKLSTYPEVKFDYLSPGISGEVFAIDGDSFKWMPATPTTTTRMNLTDVGDVAEESVEKRKMSLYEQLKQASAQHYTTFKAPDTEQPYEEMRAEHSSFNDLADSLIWEVESKPTLKAEYRTPEYKIPKDMYKGKRINDIPKSLGKDVATTYVGNFHMSRTQEHLDRLLSFMDYPQPWPDIDSITDILYKNSKLEISINDSEYQSDGRSLDFHDGSRYRVQSLGHFELRSDTVLPEESEQSGVSVQPRGPRRSTRTIRVDRSSGSKNSGPQLKG